MADVVDQDQVHKDGTDHIKDKVFGEGEGQGTVASPETSKPEPIATPQPPASNPGAEDPSGGIPKGAGGVSSAAHVESPAAGNKEKRKSIVGQLKGLFLGDKKEKEREASEAGTAKQGDTTTGAVAAGAAGTGVAAAGPAVQNNWVPADDSATKSTTQQVKEAVTGTTEANTGTAAAATSEPTEPVDTKMEEPKEESKLEPTDTSGDSAHKPPAPAGGKPPENRDAIPTAGGERLGDKHWGESKIVPDNPAAKKAEESSGAAVASSEGQPTEEVKDNTAKNTGGATGGPKSESTPASGEKKTKFMDKVKDKLPFGKKE